MGSESLFSTTQSKADSLPGRSVRLAVFLHQGWLPLVSGECRVPRGQELGWVSLPARTAWHKRVSSL